MGSFPSKPLYVVERMKKRVSLYIWITPKIPASGIFRHLRIKVSIFFIWKYKKKKRKYTKVLPVLTLYFSLKIRQTNKQICYIKNTILQSLFFLVRIFQALKIFDMNLSFETEKKGRISCWNYIWTTALSPNK